MKNTVLTVPGAWIFGPLAQGGRLLGMGIAVHADKMVRTEGYTVGFKETCWQGGGGNGWGV